MAHDIASEHKRGSYYTLDPTDIFVNEEDRGRFTPPTEDEIIKLAVSISEYGQRQPVECRMMTDKRLRLTMGFSRMAAIRLLRDGFELDGKTYHDPDIRIHTLVANVDDKKAFIHNVVENRHRNQTTPIDDAHNQDHLRERYTFSDADIAKLYGMQVSQVAKLSKLLILPPEYQTMVHDGRLPVSAALELLELPEDQWAAVIAETANAGGKVVGTEVKAKVRAHHLRDDKPKGNTTTAKPVHKTRSVKEIRSYFETAKVMDSPVGSLAKFVLSFVNGEVSNEHFTAQLEKVLAKAGVVEIDEEQLEIAIEA